MSKNFEWPVRVYYEDTDSGGVVYYANYLRFFERARTEWLRTLGFEQDVLRAENGILFAVRAVQADYLKPAVFNDSLSVSARVVSVGRASLTFEQEVLRGSADPQVLCRGTVRIACLSDQTMRPAEIPPKLLECIENDP